MAKQHFEDLQIWQEARRLTKRIYDLTKGQAFSRDFGLVDQIRRACISMSSNIAEGYERGGNREFFQFLSVAKGSSGEVRSQLYLAFDQGYIEREELQELAGEFRKLAAMISSFIRHLKTSTCRGAKYNSTDP